jgi:hypothetical protein
MSLMELDVNVFDAWTFRRTGAGVEYLLLHTSQEKADRWFNGGRFWQIPSHWIGATERVPDAVRRLLAGFGAEPRAIWAAEYTYTIYNRRFERMQLISVYAAEVTAGEIRLDPVEHAEFRWCSFDVFEEWGHSSFASKRGRASRHHELPRHAPFAREAGK